LCRCIFRNSTHRERFKRKRGSRSSYIHKSIRPENRVENTCALELTCLWIILLSLTLSPRTARSLQLIQHNFFYTISRALVCISFMDFYFLFSFFFLKKLQFILVFVFPMPQTLCARFEEFFFSCYCYWFSTLAEVLKCLKAFLWRTNQ
jgi:hypothetical protein